MECFALYWQGRLECLNSSPTRLLSPGRLFEVVDASPVVVSVFEDGLIGHSPNPISSTEIREAPLKN